MGVLDAMLAWKERRHLRQSMSSPFVRPYFRDSFRYYEEGRSVTISAEMLLGPIQRVVYRSRPLRWSDTKSELSASERKRVFDALDTYFVAHHITWKDAQI